jgi:uncharacterized protein
MTRPLPLQMSAADARRLLVAHHLRQGDLASTLQRLGSVQFDPLKPVGRNPDLVLQARVPGYRVDDWEGAAYRDRLIYDGWDKQASLVLMADWPQRRIMHAWHEGWWRERILDAHGDAVEEVLAEIERRGPLASTDVEYQRHHAEWEGSWYGPKLTTHVLRALWHTGRVVTHSRRGGHHVYDLAERVVPPHLFDAPPLTPRDSLEWLVLLRHRAVGLLRPTASQEVWSTSVPAAELVAVDVEGDRYHAVPATLDEAGGGDGPDDRMRFIAPLDQLMWDRTAVERLFGFEYRWEVYVPEAKRRWGYYVLPVVHRGRFVARFDSRLTDGVWQLHRWIWEADADPDTGALLALEHAVADFRRYLGAGRVRLPRGMDARTRAAWQAGARA